jgi:hypothetical protein
VSQSLRLDKKFFLYEFQKVEEKYISLSRIILPMVLYKAPKDGPNGIKQINKRHKLKLSGDSAVKIKNNIRSILQMPI